MLMAFVNGAGNVILRVKIRSTSAPYGGLTGLSSSSSGMKISTIADNEATATAYTVAASNVETITTLGTFAAPTSGKCRFREVDATNHPGLYEIQIATARYGVAAAKSLLVTVSGASGAAECDALIPLWSLNPYNGTNASLTALPAFDASTGGGLPTIGSSTGQISLALGRVTVGTIIADAVSASALATDAVTEIAGGIWNAARSSYTTAGTFGEYVNADTIAISGDATAANNLEAALDGTGGVTITAGLTGNVTGNLSGSVGSVSGAVGSVTGNVGGNVTGSVGSVVGAVGSVTGNVGGNVTGSVGSVASGGITAASLATGAITAAKFAAGAIDAAAIATNAIDADALATDAVTEIAAGAIDIVRTGTAQAGGSTSITLDAGASSTNDTYTGQLILTTGGTGPSQSRIITAYNGSTKVATVDRAWATNPTSSTTFAIFAQGPGYLLETLSARLTSTRANNLDNLNVSLSTINTNLSAVQTIVTTSGVAIADGYITAAKIATGAITAAKFAAGAIDAAALATDAGTEIGNAVWAISVPGSFSSGQAGNVLGNIATGTPPTAAAIATQVWSTAVPGSFSSGQAGNVLGNVAGGTDPWSVSLPGSYGSGTAGNILGNRLDAAVSSRSTYAGGDTSGTTTLISLLTPTRAGYLDNLAGGSVATASALTSVANNVTAILDDTGTTGVVVSAGSKAGYSLASSQTFNMTGNITGNLSGSVGSIATGGITSTSFAAGAIDAAAIAADAIGSSELAASAVTEIAAGVLTTALTESYAADGSPPTLTQAVMLTMQGLTEFAISGTTLTVKKLDGSTTAATFTLDSATSPTSRTRAS